MTRRAAIIVALCVFVLSCRPARDSHAPRHLFLITVDTLRADHMSLYGYARPTTPRLAEIARRGAVFDRAISQWPKTGTSFASMMTGRYPQSTGLTHEAALRVPDTLPVLSEQFRRHGFTTLAVVSNAVLSRELGWDRGFDEYVESWQGELTEDPVAYRRLMFAGRINQLARAAIEKHRNDDRLMVWIHYSDPHAPYILPEGETNPYVDDEIYRASPPVELALGERNDHYVPGARNDLRYYVAQYDANIRVVDQNVGELIEWLEAEGLLRESAVVLFADHGEDLGEHRNSYFEHGRFAYNTTAHVPLLMLGPGVEPGRRVSRPVELVDLFPTLSSWLLGDDETSGLDGENLLPTVRPGAAGDSATKNDERHALAFSEAGRRGRERLRSVQDARFKLIYAAPGARARQRKRPPRLELYDLGQDPGEERDLAQAPDSEPQVRRLLRQLQEWMQGAMPDAGPQEPRTEEQLKALKALGYVD